MKVARTPWVSILCMGLINACTMSTLIGFILIAGLLGNRYAQNPAWSTVPLAAFVAGITLFVIPASLYMARFGRRSGFALSTLAGMVGSVLIIVSVQYQSFFAIMCAGFMIGFMVAFQTYMRFAALEISPKKMHGRAASLVLGGGIIAAFIGPHLGTVVHVMSGIERYRAFGFSAVAINILAFILVLLTRFGTPSAPATIWTTPPVAQRLLHAAKSLLASSLFLRAGIASVSGFAIMSLVMNATPLALTNVHDYSLETAAFVIQNHVLGMFVPFIFSGYLIDRFSAPRIIYSGFIVYAACFIILLLSDALLAFHAGLILLGIGWNFTFLGGTTLLFDPRLQQQGAIALPLNEFCTNLGNFVAASLAGAMLYFTGWPPILMLAATATVLTAMAFSWHNRQVRAIS